MAKRKLQGFRYKLVEPFGWTLRLDKRPIFHKIDVVGTAVTPDGEMVAVRFAHKVELANPDVDVAALVGQVQVLRKSGVADPQSPELWFWNEKFWVKARSSDGSPYYNDKTYLIYEVSVKDADKLLATINEGFEQAG